MNDQLVHALNERFKQVDKGLGSLVLQQKETEKVLKGIIGHINRRAQSDAIGMYKEILARNTENPPSTQT